MYVVFLRPTAQMERLTKNPCALYHHVQKCWDFSHHLWRPPVVSILHVESARVFQNCNKISQVPCTSKSYHAHQTVGCITHISLLHFTLLTVTQLHPQNAFHNWKKRCEAHCLCSISSITKRPSSCVLSYTKSNPAVSIRNPRCYITMSKLCKWSTSPARGHTSHELGR